MSVTLYGDMPPAVISLSLSPPAPPSMAPLHPAHVTELVRQQADEHVEAVAAELGVLGSFDSKTIQSFESGQVNMYGCIILRK